MRSFLGIGNRNDSKKSCPNGKTCEIGGVSYEDVKAAWDDHEGQF